ncbi:hypothetical protein MKW92_038441 [Papaver armeniacum]|nr:hypothetical protein MKW92_038441 [Papaver armeniacum]
MSTISLSHSNNFITMIFTSSPHHSHSASLLLLHNRKRQIFASSTLTDFSKVRKVEKTREKNHQIFNDEVWYSKEAVCISSLTTNEHIDGLIHSLEDKTHPHNDQCTENYALILQNCRKLDYLELGLQIHGRLIVSGVELCSFLSSQLLELYCKLGYIDSARQLFNTMSQRNVFSWTSIIGLYCGLGDYEETIKLFYLMIEEGVRPDHFVFPKIYKACSELRNYEVGKDVYDYMLSIGFEGNPFVKKSILDMFIKCGKMDIAKRMFDKMQFKDVVTWNMMVSAYASMGDFEQALYHFESMKLAGVKPDRITWNSIITGYAQNGQFEEASNCFFEMSGSQNFKPNVVSWTALIAGNEQNGCSVQALNVFRKMVIERVKPNSITISSVISACTNLSLLRHGKEIHGYCIKAERLDLDVLVGNSFVDFYAKCRNPEVARRNFDLIKQKDLVSWNAMLAGYALRGCREEALELLDAMKVQGVKPDIITWNGLITGYTQSRDGKTALEFFSKMRQTDVSPNTITISGALAACALTDNLKLGKEIHGFVIRNQMELSTGVGSALISMYSSCGQLRLGLSVFRELSTRDVVIWNSIVAACAQGGQGTNALNLLTDMKLSNVEPNTVTMVSALPACARLAALRQGKEIHQYILRHGLDTCNFIWNSLIDMYGRCGEIRKARKIFNMMPQRDLVSWNTLISCYGMHGFGMDAVNVFLRLRTTDLIPNHFTFTNLLSACSHSGLIDEGWEYFEMMKSEYKIEPAVEQYACMVDLLARAGQFDETMKLLKEMPIEPNAAVWGSLLGACRIHSNLRLAEYAAGYLFDLEPQNSGNYILLANIYSQAGKWDDAARIRQMMKDRGITKPPGCSWIEVKRRVHSFIVGDTTHPLMHDIYAKMESLYSDIKKIGYIPDTNFVLQDVGEDEKEFSLCGHSEKLAIAFGLISTPVGTPLRIIKNLRVCGDCHSATKFISKVEKREIVMRDSYRFHHFVDGVCSCGDYW